jgi:hypothetical protein
MSAATPSEQLGEAIAELAARIDAATYELLVLIERFDASAGWNTGFQSCAHWLNWRTGVELGAAREKVRVARALMALPVVSDAMRRGELSYSKVRAITRVARPENEQRLVDAARSSTAAQVERLVRAWRRIDRMEASGEAERQQQHRHLETWVDDDGMLVIRGRLTPEAGAVLRRALEAAEDTLHRAAAESPTNSQDHEVTAGQRRADAVALVAESALTASLDRGHAGDRYQVVIHVEEQALVGAGQAASGQAALEDPDGQHVSAETSRRVACDATTVTIRHAASGSVLNVGRRTRTIPPAIRRALLARDRRCRFPGCTSRYCDAHHVQHWADGGPTSLENLVLLCRRHHRSVHEEGWTIDRASDGELAFWRPDGKRLELAPAPPAWDLQQPPLTSTDHSLAEAGVLTDSWTVVPVWQGDRFDLAWAVDVLRGN